jgi:hypothetical protein
MITLVFATNSNDREQINRIELARFADHGEALIFQSMFNTSSDDWISYEISGCDHSELDDENIHKLPFKQMPWDLLCLALDALTRTKAVARLYPPKSTV